MARIVVSADGMVDAPAETVYRYIADMREHHPRFLPPAFSDFRVESGGVGAGTVLHYKVTAGGRTREFRTKVAEPEPGRVLTESDTNSSSVTAIMALAGLSGARCAYQLVITLTSQGPEPVTGPRLPKQHDMSCPLLSQRVPRSESSRNRPAC